MLPHLFEEWHADLMLLLVDLLTLNMGLNPADEALALLLSDLQALDHV